MTALVAVFVVICVAMVVLQVVRAQTHGPMVNWIPRRWRPHVNEYYRRKGWPQPYDEEGNRLSWWRKTE